MRILIFLFLIAAVAGFPPEASAAEKRFALVIGNAEYTGKPLSPLKNPTNDAALISESLKRAGFEVTLIMNADLRGMKKSVATLGNKLKDAGGKAIGLFYYSGHGFQANNINYLAPLKANLQDEVDAEFEALSVDWVLAKLDASNKGANIVILDACRNTALTRGMRSAGQGLALLKSTPTGSFISFATAPGSTAADGAGLNSPYSAAIAREIALPGMSIEQVFKNVRKSVVAQTKGAQVPWDYSSLTSDVVFVPGDDAVAVARSVGSNDAAAMQVELQFWNDVKNSGDAKQLNAYLVKFPKGAFAAVAKSRIEELSSGGSNVAQVEKLFARLTSKSLIVENPARPHEFYANARMRELQGDYLRARQDYLKFFAFGEAYVDPHYRFQAFLKVQEGREGAWETYLSLARGKNDPVLHFVTDLLQKREQRVKRLEAYTKTYPDFAPAYYELSRDFSQARLGQQSLADKKREHALLTSFMKLVEGGKFLKYFLDQQTAAKQIEDAKQRLAALSFLNSVAMKNPVKLNAIRSNQGWILSLSIADQTTEIFVTKPGQPEVSTGFMQGAINQTTGKPVPYPSITLPGNAQPMELKVSYTDVRGKKQGPFPVMFNPNAALVASQKSILERLPTGWLSFRDWDGNLLVYFSHLVSYRCAISRVEFGVDADTPDNQFHLQPCDPNNPHSVNYKGKPSMIHLQIPKQTRYMTVKLTYADGTQSKVQRFEVIK